MQERRRSSVVSLVSGGITATALGLSLDARRDIISLNNDLSRMLQKDIVGQLPPEIAVLILSELDLDDILRCRLVSRDWATLCDEQSLWATFCTMSIPPVRPRHTTWADLTLHQQLLHLPRPISMPEDDEASFESNLDDLTLDVGGVDVISTQSGAESLAMAGGVRGMVWERSGYGLPTHHRPASPSTPTGSRRIPRVSISPRNKRQRPDWADQPSRSIPFQAVQSHLALPTPVPQVNYKHLYIVNDILVRRIVGGHSSQSVQPEKAVKPVAYQVRPRTVDAISSIEAGGLPGHSETIYALQLISRQMSINMVPSSGSTQPHQRSDDPGAFWRSKTHSSSPPPNPISGRDWLLSASRDHTLRLWQLSCAKPRVVKVFQGGHSGSVLCLAVTDVPVTTDNVLAGSPLRFRRRSRRASEMRTRLMAVSGGNDGRLCLWDVEHGDGRPEKIVDAHADSVLCVRADDERIVTSSKDRTIKVFDVQTLQQLLVIGCGETEGLHRGAINSVCLTKEYILSASGDKTLRIWSIHTGALLAYIDVGTRGIASMDFALPPQHSHPALRGIIVIGSSDASIKVYHLISHIPGVDIVDALDIIPPLRNLTLRDMLLHQEDEMESEGYSYGDAESTAEWASLAGREEVDDAPDEADVELRLEAAGQCWASCACPARSNTSDSALCTRCFNRGHTDLVRSVHLGEKVIISGSYDSTVKVWDRSTGRLLRNLTGVHSGRVFSVVGDRLRIISSGLDARISIWDFSEGLDTAFVEP